MTVFLTENLLIEEMGWDSFRTYVARKLKGYSHGEIDHLAKLAIHVDSHESKMETLERIDDAEKAAKAKLEKEKEEYKKREIKLHIEILGTLRAKLHAFDIVDHLEKKKAAAEGKTTVNSEENKEDKGDKLDSSSSNFFGPKNS